MFWILKLGVKLFFLALVVVFSLNFLSRLASPFRSARQTKAYYASILPGPGAGPASPGHPGVVEGPPAGHALPALEPPDCQHR